MSLLAEKTWKINCNGKLPVMENFYSKIKTRI